MNAVHQATDQGCDATMIDWRSGKKEAAFVIKRAVGCSSTAAAKQVLSAHHNAVSLSSNALRQQALSGKKQAAAMKESTGKSSVRYVRVASGHAGQRLDNYLMAALEGVPRSLVYRLVRTGQVRVNSRRVRPMARLEEGDEVRIPPVAVRAAEVRQVPDDLVEKIRQNVIAQTDELIVVNKPAGVAVQGGSGLSWGLMDVLGRIFDSCYPVHRLDRATSGVLVVARNHGAARQLSDAFAHHQVERRYLTLMQGDLPAGLTTVDRALKKIRDRSGQRRVIAAEDGRRAVTHFKRVEKLNGYSLAEARLETGRTHQIRVHAASIGHALAGDRLYNRQPAPAGLKRMFLHASSLELPWPVRRCYSAPLPNELTALIDGLRQTAL